MDEIKLDYSNLLEMQKLGIGPTTLEQVIVALSERHGKAAVMRLVLSALDLDERSVVEKLAELAFDLVPGEIEYIYNTSMLPLATTSIFIDGVQERFELKRYAPSARMAWSQRRKTLVVQEVADG